MRCFLATGQNTFDRLCCVDFAEPDHDLASSDEAPENDGGNSATTNGHLVSKLLETLPTFQEKKTPDKMGLSLSLLQLGCPGSLCWERLVIIKTCDFDTRLSYSMIKTAKCVVFSSAMMSYIVFMGFTVSSYHCRVTPS